MNRETQHVVGVFKRNPEDEDALRGRIKQLKEREKRIREERHRLESQLREKIYKRFKEIEEKIA